MTKFLSMKIFSDQFGLPISMTGTCATITIAQINEHLSTIAAVFTIAYTAVCIFHKVVMIKKDKADINKAKRKKTKNED